MVAARTDIEGGPIVAFTAEIDRCHHRHVGQMRAAVIGVVQHIDIARPHAPGVARHHRLDRLAHRAQVHRHVRRVGDQAAVGVEQGAREVEPLLDVDRVGGVLQLQAHLLSNVHEQVVEDLEQHRVDLRADGVARLARCHAVEQQVVERRDAGLPARLDDGGGIALGDDRRAGDDVAGLRVAALDQRRVVPAAFAEQAHRRCRRRFAIRVEGVFGLGRGIAGADRLDRDGLDDQPPARHEKSEALPVGRFEC